MFSVLPAPSSAQLLLEFIKNNVFEMLLRNKSTARVLLPWLNTKQSSIFSVLTLATVVLIFHLFWLGKGFGSSDGWSVWRCQDLPGPSHQYQGQKCQKAQRQHNRCVPTCVNTPRCIFVPYVVFNNTARPRDTYVIGISAWFVFLPFCGFALWVSWVGYGAVFSNLRFGNHNDIRRVDQLSGLGHDHQDFGDLENCSFRPSNNNLVVRRKNEKISSPYNCYWIISEVSGCQSAGKIQFKTILKQQFELT